MLDNPKDIEDFNDWYMQKNHELHPEQNQISTLLDQLLIAIDEYQAQSHNTPLPTLLLTLHDVLISSRDFDKDSDLSSGYFEKLADGETINNDGIVEEPPIPENNLFQLDHKFVDLAPARYLNYLISPTGSVKIIDLPKLTLAQVLTMCEQRPVEFLSNQPPSQISYLEKTEFLTNHPLLPMIDYRIGLLVNLETNQYIYLVKTIQDDWHMVSGVLPSELYLSDGENE